MPGVRAALGSATRVRNGANYLSWLLFTFLLRPQRTHFGLSVPSHMPSLNMRAGSQLQMIFCSALLGLVLFLSARLASSRSFAAAAAPSFPASSEPEPTPG